MSANAHLGYKTVNNGKENITINVRPIVTNGAVRGMKLETNTWQVLPGWLARL